METAPKECITHVCKLLQSTGQLAEFRFNISVAGFVRLH